ncbi:MAG TPA: alpha-ketoglutarate-dependent dioxygenase AlkB [Beijerinckiaceae bacterium]|nr:alpha-ketoglutarate-dependent dioxygenase AlkB [Beijerinckiaceae bacterium]
MLARCHALAPGLLYAPDFLDRARQERLLATLHEALRHAPLFTPSMPRTGKPFSVRMSTCGPLGWVSDRDGGYRYQKLHPDTGNPWPPIPDVALETWQKLAEHPAPPQACLVNYYAVDARMALHQDRDEDDLGAPVLSLSLGDSCLFRFGGTARGGKTRSVKLHSGDALVLGGESRLAYHGVDKIFAGSSTLLPEGGRFNLTLRRVTRYSTAEDEGKACRDLPNRADLRSNG